MEENDPIVRTIDVYLSHPKDREVSIFQFPLRKRNNPYDTSPIAVLKKERDGNTLTAEIPLELELGQRDLDHNFQLDGVTLNGIRVDSSVNHALATISSDGTQLHLTPVSSFYQFRPSMDHTNEEELLNKKVKIFDEVPLETDSETVKEQFLMCSTTRPINWNVEADRYIRQLSPQDSMGSHIPVVTMLPLQANLTRSHLQKLKPEKSVKMILEHAQMARLSQLQSLLSISSEPSSLLAHVQKSARLVQGIWIIKSELLPGLSPEEQVYRDYFLRWFTASRTVPRKTILNATGLDLQKATQLINPVAEPRPGRGWMFASNPDSEFMSLFTDVNASQIQAWERDTDRIVSTLKRIADKANKTVRVEVPPPPAAFRQYSDYPEIAGQDLLFTESGPDSTANGKRTELGDFLVSVFKERGLMSYSSLRSAWESKAGQIDEILFKEVLSKVALPLRDMYYLRVLGDERDIYRDVIVNLFKENTQLKKAQINQAIVDKKGVDNLPHRVYRDLMKEFAVHQRNFWVLKGFTKDE